MNKSNYRRTGTRWTTIPGGVLAVYEVRAASWSRMHDLFEVRGVDNRLTRIAQDLVKRVSRRSEPKIADFGCGDGRLLARLMNKVAAGYFAGVDQSVSMLCAARPRIEAIARRNRLDFTLICTEAASTPFPTGTFDLTTAKLVLHHHPRPLAMIREMARVTKPGGHILVMVPGPGYQREFRLGHGCWRPMGFPPRHARGEDDPLGRFTVEQLKDLAHEAGLHVDAYADDFVYRFAGLTEYLEFMRLTGAEAKLRCYRDAQQDWAQMYHGLFANVTGPLQIAGEFVTMDAYTVGNDQ